MKPALKLVKSAPPPRVGLARRAASWVGGLFRRPSPAPVKRAAGLYNPYTGQGIVGRDVSLEDAFSRDPDLDPETLDALYNDNALCRRAVEKLPQEALRKGYYVEVFDPPKNKAYRRPMIAAEQSAKINEMHRVLRARDEILKAAIFGRNKGGAAVVMGIDDGATSPEAPVNEKAIRGVRYLEVVERPQLTIASYYTEPRQPKFGKPMLFEVRPLPRPGQNTPATYKVHESRVLFFGGALTTDKRKSSNQGFDLSVLQAPWKILRANASAWSMASQMLRENGLGVMKVDELAEQESDPTGASALQTRAQELDYVKNFMKTVMIHTTESYDRIPVPLAGVRDFLEAEMQVVAMALDMPVTILWGRSPAGLNATGESDLEGWYNSIGSYQETDIRRAVERLTTLFFLSAEGPTAGEIPKSWKLCFPPLRQMTEKETAELRKTVAETDAIYIEKAGIREEEIAVSRFGPGGWSMETDIDLDARYEALAEPAEEEPEPAGEPPDPPEPTTDSVRKDLQLRGRRIAEWEAGPNACDRCKALDGKLVDASLDVEDVAHPNCECGLKPVDYDEPEPTGSLERSVTAP